MDEQVSQMFNQDRLIQHLGAHLVSYNHNYAKIELKVTEQHLQGHQTCKRCRDFCTGRCGLCNCLQYW